ncbi:MAG: glycosyltransferase [Vicinamibacterales bacterium]
MGSPRVSVVVTCFNLGAYLPELIASLRAQTFRDFEMCVVDDGSTDALTLRVLRGLAPDITVIYSENRGLSAARNLGVSSTSGEYVCAVDADDVLLPTLLEQSVRRLDSDPTLAFVSHWLEAFGDESWEWKPEGCDFPSLLDTNKVNGAALVRRTAVQAVGGWDEEMRGGCEDWDLWITLVEAGYRGEIIPQVLFRYRRRPDSMSRLMSVGDGLSRLYRRLVDKHPDAFRPYLKALIARREADAAGSRAQADDLEERLELDVLPSLARANDDLASAERRRTQWDHERRMEEEQRHLRDEAASLRDEAASLRDEAASLRVQLETARGEVGHQDHHRQLALQEVAALHASLSWRLTRPLRAIGGLLIGVAGRRS